MSEFERENQEVISMVHENRRRSGITQPTELILIPKQKALEMIRNSTGRHQDTPLLILSGILLIVTLAVSLSAALA